MPHITLRLRGELAKVLPGGTQEFDLESGTTLEDFLSEHGLAARHYVVMLNNEVSPSRETVLKDGDHIVVHPQMAGG